MHEGRFASYKLTVSKDKVFKDLNRKVKQLSDYCGGISQIEWKDRIFDSYDDAYKYIMDNWWGDYQCVAYKYRDIDSLKMSKKVIELEKRIIETRNQYDSLNSKIHYKDIQAKYVTCKECGSKINKDYLRSNRCPICNKDMRPETVLNKLESMTSKIEKLKGDLKVEKMKRIDKAPIKWLVKYEYHC